jgi:hypothetical protein
MRKIKDELLLKELQSSIPHQQIRSYINYLK